MKHDTRAHDGVCVPVEFYLRVFTDTGLTVTSFLSVPMYSSAFDFFFFQSIKNAKTILSSSAVQEEVIGGVWQPGQLAGTVITRKPLLS